MLIGVALGTYSPESRRPTPLHELAEQAARAEQLGYASAWVMDHFWLERPGGRRGAHDPFVTLGFLAARTDRIQLGLLVACAPFRHPGQLAREGAAVADAAPGRFILGLGSGWHQDEFDAFDFPFEQRVSRFEEYVEIVTRLLSGERFGYDGRFYSLRDASVLRTAEAPPVWVAAQGPRMLRLTARRADGWNTAWIRATPGDRKQFAQLLAELRRAEPSRKVTVSVGVLVEPDPDAVRAAVAAYADVDHLILNFGAQPFGAYDPAALERAAPALAAT